MLVHLFHEVTCRTAVLTRIEFTWLFSEYLANSSSEGKTRVRVDVDLANSALRSLAELLFRNTNCIGELTTVSVDDVNLFLRN